MRTRKTCFVVMPIGDQDFGEHKVSANDLRNKYSNLIAEAIKSVRGDIDVIRADEIVSGGITNDIYERLMRSDYVIADISYPNPNVYYELGIRHACRVGTIVIRDRNSPFRPPFDVQDVRYIEYQDTSTGLKSLRAQLEQRLAWIDSNPSTPDSKFLEYAQYVKFEFPRYGQDPHGEFADVTLTLLKHPQLIEDLQEASATGDTRRALTLAAQYPEAAKSLIMFLSRQGKLKVPW